MNLNGLTHAPSDLYQPGYWDNDAGMNVIVRGNKIVYCRSNDNQFDIFDVLNNTWSIGVLSQPLPGFISVVSQFSTPYSGMGNDPINFIDPSGGLIVPPGADMLSGAILPDFLISFTRTASTISRVASIAGKASMIVSYGRLITLGIQTVVSRTEGIMSQAQSTPFSGWSESSGLDPELDLMKKVQALLQTNETSKFEEGMKLIYEFYAVLQVPSWRSDFVLAFSSADIHTTNIEELENQPISTTITFSTNIIKSFAAKPTCEAFGSLVRQFYHELIHVQQLLGLGQFSDKDYKGDQNKGEREFLAYYMTLFEGSLPSVTAKEMKMSISHATSDATPGFGNFYHRIGSKDLQKKYRGMYDSMKALERTLNLGR